MNITILAYLEPDSAEPDVVVPQVVEALRKGSHNTTVVTIRNDIQQLVDGVKASQPDLVFNLVESFADDMVGGLIGVAGALDLLQVPFTGGGPGELYLQEDKALSKKLLAFEQIRCPDFAVFAPDADFETGGNLRMPLFVKPLRMEASQGIDEKSLVRNTQELMERVLHIHKSIGDAALAEEFIQGREFYVGVLGNQEAAAFPPVEMDFSGLPEGKPRILDNKAKWDESSTQFKGTKSVLPELPPELCAKLQKVALDACRAVRVRDYGRVDLRLTDDGEIFVIEVNANCYLEESSEFAMAAAAEGIEYVALINRIVEIAAQRRGVRPARRHRNRARPQAREANAPHESASSPEFNRRLSAE
jgi:D-alanine-D-alanine ligase